MSHLQTLLNTFLSSSYSDSDTDTPSGKEGGGRREEGGGGKAKSRGRLSSFKRIKSRNTTVGKDKEKEGGEAIEGSKAGEEKEGSVVILEKNSDDPPVIVRTTDNGESSSEARDKF
jgi:hypothetical protein